MFDHAPLPWFGFCLPASNAQPRRANEPGVVERGGDAERGTPARSGSRSRFAVVLGWLLVAGWWVGVGPVAGWAQELDGQEEQAFRQAAARVAPSLVKIETVGGLDKVQQVLIGTGPTTGVMVDKEGLIISSAFNFISRPATILVTLPDGRRLPATQVATDHLRMLTLLKVVADNLTPPEVCPPSEFAVGQWALALGKSLDEQPSVSLGIV